MDLDRPWIRVEGGLQPQGLVGREEAGIGELDIPELAADGAECLAARREGQLQIGRRGHDRRVLHAVVGEVRRQAQVEPRLPGRSRPALRDPEQRVGRRRQPRHPRLLGLVPEPFALPGVERQADEPPRLGHQSAPVDGWPSACSAPSELQHRGPLVLVAAQRRQHGRALALTVGSTRSPPPSAPGVRLSSTAVSQPSSIETLHAVGEPDRPADVVPPVFRAELRPLDRAARDGGEQGQGRRPRPDALQRGEQFVADRVHLGAVEGILDPQEPAEHAAFFEPARELLQRPDLRPRA